ncbi:uncharacterized protein LOC125523515 [Triticum urartu]|uniref:uncharacterized protein LOC125523515 n=1 Tax=Triticum urartu TaxID=4572 RepID=UPI002042F0F3|nr:uncharacterized protein LOC125523515 [Triticum urartu]
MSDPAEDAAALARAWIVVDRLTVPVPEGGLAKLAGADLLVAFQEAPAPSKVFLPDRVSDRPLYVAAADAKGFFVLCEVQGPALQGPEVFYGCDAGKGVVTRIPERPVLDHLDIAGNECVVGPRATKIGVMAKNSIYLVAELSHASADATQLALFCYSPSIGQWVEKELALPSFALRPWHGNFTISHLNKMWWVDLSFGVLCCDPFAESPVLTYFPLPPGCELPLELHQQQLSRTWCLGISGKTLRFVNLEGTGASVIIKAWSFVSDDEPAGWMPEFELPEVEIWAGQSNRPYGVLSSPFVSPVAADFICLLKGSVLFWVDLKSGQNSLFYRLPTLEVDGATGVEPRFMPLQMVWCPWAIVASTDVCNDQLKDEMRLERSAPPVQSSLVYGNTCVRNRTTKYMYLAAIERSGAMLICAGIQRIGDIAIKKVYFVRHDITEKSHKRLPDLGHGALVHGNVGLVVDKEGVCVVAELVRTKNKNSGLIRLWRSDDKRDKWTDKEVNFPLQGSRRWNGNGAISWGGKIWWIDLSQGLMSYDPFGAKSKLCYIAFPGGHEIAENDINPLIVESRLVNISCGKLQYAELHGPDEEPVITVWTMVAQSKGMSWRRKYDLKLTEVWSKKSFHGKGLRRERPALALLHPFNNEVIYLTQEAKLISVNVSSAEVKECVPCVLEDKATDCRSGKFIVYDMPLKCIGLFPRPYVLQS